MVDNIAGDDEKNVLLYIFATESQTESSNVELMHNYESHEISDGDVEISFSSTLLQNNIVLKQQKKKGIAFQLWPAATALCKYLEDNKEIYIMNIFF
jgi:hypothetical protein